MQGSLVPSSAREKSRSEYGIVGTNIPKHMRKSSQQT